MGYYKKLTTIVLLATIMLTIHSCGLTQRKTHQDDERFRIAQNAEQQALAKGQQMWFDPNLGTNGFSCESCHPKGEMTNVETYPRYKHVLGSMATLSMTHNFAIVNESKGKAWELGSEDANALTLFVTFLANGKSIRLWLPDDIKKPYFEKGQAAFHDPSLGINGNTCASCHKDGGKSSNMIDGMQIPKLKGVPAYYPRYSSKTQKVITLEQQINTCIKDYMNQDPLPLDDNTLVALCFYLTSISEDIKISVARLK